MISYDEALALVAKESELQPHEAIAPKDTLGRVLAKAITATRSLPPFDNTAMDGFALRAQDSFGAPVKLPVVGSFAAGDVPTTPEQAGAIEIMTGAPMPDWCDCVVPIENVDVQRAADGVPVAVTIKTPIPKGQHIRRAGEDVQAGQALVGAGTRITPEILAVLTALGLDKVQVTTRPAIALIGTGQEVIRDPAQDLNPGQIYDSNTPYLRAALHREGYAATVMNGSPDDTDGFLNAIKAAGDAKIIISTGAVSMGRRDFVPEALARLGARTVFHKTAIRPGKPILFARLPDGAYFFGLPGNPVSAAVGLAFFVMPLLNRLCGVSAASATPAVLAAAFNKKKGLTMFAKARLDGDQVTVLHGQQSFRLAPLLEAHGWAILPAAAEAMQAGDPVGFQPF